MDAFIQSLHISTSRFSDAVRRGPLDAPVAACPEWTLIDLANHMGFIHRWARLAAQTGAPPDQSAIEPPPAGNDPQVLADWIDAGADALVPVLAALDPAAPTWHPFPVPKVAGVWPRRQAHETQVHAWDAEHAVGPTSPLDPDIAADGIAEYFEIIVPRVLKRDGRAAPVGSMTIDCVDTDFRLIVGSPDGATVQVQRSAAGGDAQGPMLRGGAESILLSLWGRAERPQGDHGPVVNEWLAFGGN
jgi:uncharacterized protein (TIGR03083 family)